MLDCIRTVIIQNGKQRSEQMSSKPVTDTGCHLKERAVLPSPSFRDFSLLYFRVSSCCHIILGKEESNSFYRYLRGRTNKSSNICTGENIASTQALESSTTVLGWKTEIPSQAKMHIFEKFPVQKRVKCQFLVIRDFKNNSGLGSS